MDAYGAAPAARHIGAGTGERDVLRRPVAAGSRQHAAGASVVDDELLAVARADPDVPPIRRPRNVVRAERRPERAREPRIGATREIDDRDLLRLRAERDPERA